MIISWKIAEGQIVTESGAGMTRVEPGTKTNLNLLYLKKLYEATINKNTLNKDLLKQ
jgi:hypothetical protein